MGDDLKFLLTLAAGAAGGALIAGLFALVGAWIANRREHRQWLRNERLRAYATFFEETRPWSVVRWVSGELEQSKEAEAAELQLQLIAPKAVLEAGYSLGQQISDFRDIWMKQLDGGRAGDSQEADIFDAHVAVVEQRTASLGKAMRKSLKLPRNESNQWVSLVHKPSPSKDEFLAAMRAQLNAE